MKDANGAVVEVGDRVIFHGSVPKGRPFDTYGKVAAFDSSLDGEVALIWVEGKEVPFTHAARRRFGHNLQKVPR